MERRIINTDLTEEDVKVESHLRPQSLREYIGQEKLKSTLQIYIDAAKSRGDSLDHVLFYGPLPAWERPPCPVSLPTRWV